MSAMREQLLLVDDEPEALEELSELLESKGFVCHCAATASEAMQRLAEISDISLVITDLRLPDESGLRLIQRLRQTPLYKDLPIIVMSGHADMHDVIGLLRLQVVDVLPKPIYLEHLLDTLNQRFPLAVPLPT